MFIQGNKKSEAKLSMLRVQDSVTIFEKGGEKSQGQYIYQAYQHLNQEKK